VTYKIMAFNDVPLCTWVVFGNCMALHPRPWL